MTSKPILVVGGAGYIGSHTCRALAERSYLPVVYGNFTSGHPEFGKWGLAEQGDIRDKPRLKEVLAKYHSNAAMHLAGKGRHPGDPPGSVAGNTLAREVLGWHPKHCIDDMIGSAWKWHSTFNGGNRNRRNLNLINRADYEFKRA